MGIGKTTLWREGVPNSEWGLQVLASRPGEAPIALPFTVLDGLLGDVPDAVLGRPQARSATPSKFAAASGTKRGGLQRRAVALGVSVLFDSRRGRARSSRWTIADAVVRPPRRMPSIRGQALARRTIGFLLARRAGASEEARVESRPLWTLTASTRLVIGPLDIRSLDRLLRAQLGRQFLRPALVELQRVSGGNPFFALELGRRCSRGCLTRAGGAAAGARDSNELVRERLAGIPPRRGSGVVVSALSRPTSSWWPPPPAVGVGRPRSRRPQPPESWRSPTAAFGSHIRCSPRSSTGRHRRLGDAICTPVGGGRRRSGRAGAPSRPRCERSGCPGRRDRRGCRPTCTGTRRSARRSGALAPGASHAAR